MRPTPYMLSALAGLSLVLGGCSDTLAPEPASPPQSEFSAQHAVARLECSASRTEQSIRCVESEPGVTGAGARFAIYGANQVKLTSSNVVYDSVTAIFSFDVVVKNLLSKAIGTQNGTTVTGIKVFYGDGPRATSFVAPYDTGTVSVANPDGYGNFSRANQPYHLYNEILASQQTSAVKNWRLRMPRSVNTFSFVMYVFTYYSGEAIVPSVSPDTIPASVYADSKVVLTSATLPAPFLRDIVVILFKATASAEDRMAAVNRTLGTVIGGKRLVAGDGLYLVRLPDDGTTGPLTRALARLDSLPQVEWAGVEQVYRPGSIEAYVTPTDGSEYRDTTWNLAVDGGRNWNLEAIEAPRAWGCSTDGSSVAIVDAGFASDPELPAPYNNSVEWTETNAAAYRYHAAKVASVIAARPNNGAGMTGILWNAGISVHSYAVSPGTNWKGYSTLEARIVQAMATGTRVINLSIGTPYTDSLGNPRAPDTTSVQDAMKAEYEGRRVSSVIRYVQGFGFDPLFVVAAGNLGVSARFNGYARLADPAAVGDDFASRVIVVGAVQRAGGAAGPGNAFEWAEFAHPIDKGSNYGPLVQIAAPGKELGVVDPSSAAPGHVVSGQGTSVAAPHVAAVAALMLSLDLRLSTPELKQLLISSAQAGGRSAVAGASGQSVPLVNAHQALRMVGARAGAKLCGNPVWQDSTGQVWARRGAGFTGPDEALFVGPKLSPSSALSVQHGTGLIRFSNGAAFSRDFLGTWKAAADTAGPNNASYLSRAGTSHDQQTVVTAVKRAGATVNQELFDIRVNGTLVTTIVGPPVRPLTPISRCVKWEPGYTEWEDDHCHEYYNTYFRWVRTNEYSISYNSERREAYLAVIRDSARASVNETVSYYAAGFYNRDQYYDDRTFDTNVFVVPLDSVTKVRTFVFPNEAVRAIAFAEGGQDAAMQRSFFSQFTTFTYDAAFSSNAKSCYVSYRTVQPTLMVTWANLPSVNVYRCYPDAGFAP